MGPSNLFGLPSPLRRSRWRAAQPHDVLPNLPHILHAGADLRAQDQVSVMSGEFGDGSRQHLDLDGIDGTKEISISDNLLHGGENRARQDAAVHRQPSSQVLGNQDYPSSHAKSLKNAGSSSTLHSYYDPTRTPLAISQQTSDSSARDLALRKGQPSVISGLSQGTRALSQSVSTSLGRPRNLKAGQNDHSTIIPKSPARSKFRDPSLQRPYHAPVEAFPMDEFPVVPFVARSSPKRKRLTKRGKSKPDWAQIVPALASPPSSVASTKVNVRRPTPGTKNWFDNLGVDSDDDDFNDTELELEPEFINGMESSFKTGSIKYPVYSDKPSAASQLKVQARAPEVTNSRFSASSIGSSDYLRSASAPLQLALHQWESLRNTARVSRRMTGVTAITKQTVKSFHGLDLRKDSALCLTSSEDELEDDQPSSQDEGKKVSGIRESVLDGVEDGSNIEIGTAYSIAPQRPRLATDRSKVNKLTLSRTVQRPLSLLRVPNRRSSKRQSFQSDISKSAPDTQDGSTRLSSSQSTLPPMLLSRATSSEECPSPPPGTMVMSVTREEESLLEAMRSKKESMRKSILAEVFRSTADAEPGKKRSSLHRPRTAGPDQTDSSFLHLGQGSISHLPQFPKHRHSLSAEDYRAFPGVFSRGSGTTEPTTTSNGLSVAYSSLPSPTASRQSPATPTFGSAIDPTSRRLSSSLNHRPGGPSDALHRHSRSRTGSSHVILLDSFPDRSVEHVEDFPAWAYSGWSDKAGLTAAD